MKKYNKLILTTIIALILNIFTLSSVALSGEESSLTLYFGNVKNDAKLAIWKLSENIDITDKQSVITSYEKLSDKEIKDKFGEPVYIFGTERARIDVNNISEGKYYARQLNVNDKEKYISPFIFEIEKNSKLEVYVKYIKERTKIGNFYFIKKEKDSSTKLQGAVFRVFEKQDNVYNEVKKDGKSYEVISNENGEFEVVDLPYGTYCLKEVSAPKGYKLLEHYIDFTINDKDNRVDRMVIENEKTPPINIPYTGDAKLLFIVILGMIIYIVGYRVAEKNKR